MKKSRLFQVVISIIFCLTFLNAVEAETLTVATGEWAPYTSEAVEGYGFCSEITTAVVKEMGMDVTYEFYPWKRCEHYITKGKAWAALPYYKNPDREEKYVFSDSIAPSRSVFFYYKDKLNGVDWKTIDDLKSYKFGGVLGYGNHETLQKNGFNVDFAADEIMNLKKLRAGRIDIFPMDELVARSLIKNNLPEEIGNFNTLSKPEAEYPLYLIVDKQNKKSVELVEQFNSALKRIKEKGIYSKILQKYNLNE
ncbi:putative ABC-type amino acid transport/signal transduction systems, periplasmic component/domain [Desulfamplus magnetovallimortis]|uniref:Putative ABC-type amino acid transport/signal transduction systems, periplasmic component/domain n=1 Tax=Desulfamplus magnetovallimortis TaxID=1246637 RepID=A0A1W1HCV1_9BACT|nr:transporter substrate-binding domain-containing protein [Desulfamplus magnetovallimortis]SLM30232.1 putative ABC-type amino acid transport/signal transduction systems, periplasmic component/domain [Desulfamplus magnetovallimortis]